MTFIFSINHFGNALHHPIVRLSDQKVSNFLAGIGGFPYL